MTFAVDLSVNDLTWEAFLTKEYASSTEQPLVSENCEFLNEKQHPRKSKVKTKAGSLSPILPSCERCSPSTRLDFACVEPSIECNDYAISRALHYNKNISPGMAANKISDKIGEINKMFKLSSSLGRHQEISALVDLLIFARKFTTFGA